MLKRSAIAAAVSALALASCAGPGKPQPRTHHSAGVEARTMVRKLELHPATGAPRRDEMTRVAAAFANTGEGVVDLVGPQPATDRAGAFLASRGIAEDKIETAEKDIEAVYAIFRARVAELPSCAPDRTGGRGPGERLVEGMRRQGRDDTNRPSETFGCATQRNLGAMLVDPGDMMSPRPRSETTAGEILGTEGDGAD